jgi:hypothetical protein
MLWWIVAATLVLGGCGVLFGLTAQLRHCALRERLVQMESAARSAREREAQRPKLRAVIEQEVAVRWHLTIQNAGQGCARQLMVSINGASLERCAMIDAGQIDPTKLAMVGGGGTIRIPLEMTRRPDKLQVELSCSDSAGELSFYEAELGASGRTPDASECQDVSGPTFAARR